MNNHYSEIQNKTSDQQGEGEKKGQPAWLKYLLAVVGLIYLLNPTAGLLEIIPDNIPLVGNLDEGVAAVLVWEGISQLRKSRGKKQAKKQETARRN